MAANGNEASPDGLDDLVERARAGDRNALESLVARVQTDVYRLALRFLWHPEDAEDATQEILIRVITHLGSYRGESAFSTWVYRVAANSLLTTRKRRMERRSVSFEEFGRDLADGISDAPIEKPPHQDEALLLEEVKVGCTTGMLLCLDRPHRLAYILGEILELDHKEGAAILQITPAAFRKRLSRARDAVNAFTRSHCGLVDPANACRCRRRLARAVELGRVDPKSLLFAHDRKRARAFSEVLEEIRALDPDRRTAALHRTSSLPEPAEAFATGLRDILDAAKS